MFVFRSTAAVLILIVALAAGSVSAYTGPAADPGLAAQTSSTPEQLCADADIVEPETRSFEQAEDVLQEGVDYWAILCTEAGAIYLDLFEAEAPLTVNNFVFLAQQNYYNNTTFHRVLPNFMAQGGDPTGTGSGDPGYSFADETDNGKTFDQAGLLAMANSGPGTNGSQFFVTYTATPWLDGNHTIFGKVYQGIEVVERLTPRDPSQMPAYLGAALNTVLIVEDSASVVATPDGAPTLEQLQYLLEAAVVDSIIPDFVKDPDSSHVYDLAGEAALYGELSGYLLDYLAGQAFAGKAALMLPLTNCPATPEAMPIWLVGFTIADYSADAAAVAADDDRAAMFVDSGSYETTELVDLAEFAGVLAVPADGDARLFSAPVQADEYCGPDGTHYRLEFPYGRYLLSIELVLDDTLVNDTTQDRPIDFLVGLLDSFVIRRVSGTLDRGNVLVE